MTALDILFGLAFVVVLFVLLIYICLPFLAGRHHSTKNDHAQLSPNALKLINLSYRHVPFWVDYHLHLVGLGSENIAWVNPKMQSIFHPLQRLRFELFSRAGGILQKDKANEEYLSRLKEITKEMPPGRIYLLAMDKTYNEKGEVNLDKTPFYVANDYLWQVVNSSKIFAPIVSIHPFKKEAIKELNAWREKGVRYIKWLPNSMGINPSDAKLHDFYATVKQLEMIILTHTGVEEAVEAKGGQEYGNPQLLRRPLEMGIKIIMAHAGSLGKCIDIESPDKPLSSCFRLTLRMLEEKQFQSNLFADISGITLINRSFEVLKTLLARKDLHHRLVYGSDYPICAVNVLVQTWLLRRRGFITEEECFALKEIYRINPLLFDFVLKRSLKLPGTTDTFPPSLFCAHPLLPT